MPHCFDNPPSAARDAGWFLAEALACYDESLQAPDQPSDIELASKVAYSKANIYVALSSYGGGDYWDDALPLLEQAINHYEAVQTDEERQRLRRIAAHAYARRGLIRFFAPGATAESHVAAGQDYQKALDLLETPMPGISCRNNLEMCYKSDKEFIKVYREQLQDIEAATKQ